MKPASTLTTASQGDHGPTPQAVPGEPGLPRLLATADRANHDTAVLEPGLDVVAATCGDTAGHGFAAPH